MAEAILVLNDHYLPVAVCIRRCGQALNPLEINDLFLH